MESHEEEVLISRDTMRKLLNSLRVYLLPRENESLPCAIRQICREISPNHEQAPINQLILALYVFPSAVQPSLKLQGIKPHWMFTLDDLIRNAVQQAIRLIGVQSTESTVICAQEALHLNQQSMEVGSHEHLENSGVSGGGCFSIDSNPQGNWPPTSTPNIIASSPSSHEHQFRLAMLNRELNEQHKAYAEQIRTLFENLVQVEKEYKEFLELSLWEKQARMNRLLGNLPPHNGHHNASAFKGEEEEDEGQASSSSVAIGVEEEDGEESLRTWLTRIGCGGNGEEEGTSTAADLLERQHYTKSDLIDFVSREELLNIGIP